MIRPIAMVLLASLLSSCGVFSTIGGLVPTFGDGDGLRGQGSEIEGLRFRSRVSKADDNRRSFIVATRDAGRNVPAALEASRVRALDYCLTTVGGTDVEWTLSPDRQVDSGTLNEDGSVTVSGFCLTR